MSQVALSFDAIVSLPLPDLKQQLADGNSQSLRDLFAYLGLGSAGTKEENRLLIYNHIEQQRHLRAGLQPAHGPPGGATDVDSGVTVLDPRRNQSNIHRAWNRVTNTFAHRTNRMFQQKRLSCEPSTISS